MFVRQQGVRGMWLFPIALLTLFLVGCDSSAGARGTLQRGPTQIGTTGPITQGSAPAQNSGSGVIGRVSDAIGHMLAGVMITPQAADLVAGPIAAKIVVTDSNGRYRWSLKAGRYMLTISKTGYISQTLPIIVGNGLTTVDVVLQPQ